MKFLQFNLRFFIIALILFLVEVAIALFVHDAFIRPFVGDVIVVWFIYFFLRSFLRIKPIYLALFTLIFSFLVEIGQYFNLVALLGLQHNRLARIVIGTSFSWGDMLCYLVGFLLLFLFDKDLRKNH